MIDLNPGIRRSVQLLRSWGYETVDSGDGETHQYECDREYPYVAITIGPHALVSGSSRLARLLSERGIPVEPIGPEPLDGGVMIQATYDPANNTAIIDVLGLHDRLLKEAGVTYG